MSEERMLRRLAEQDTKIEMLEDTIHALANAVKVFCDSPEGFSLRQQCMQVEQDACMFLTQ
jgi:hypothetical protein